TAHTTSPICSSRALSTDAFPRRSRLFQLLQLSVLLRNPFVQVLALEIGEIGRKQPAIAFNVSPMAPHLCRIEVNHPPSPLWMFLSCLVDWVGKLAARLQIAWINERSSPDWNYG